MIKSAYLDTSVCGGYFDEEFSEDTLPFFERITEEKIIVIVSELVEDELSNAPDFVVDFFNEILKGRVSYAGVNEEVEKLAETYINEKVIGLTSYADFTHIALATINKADILASCLSDLWWRTSNIL